MSSTSRAIFVESGPFTAMHNALFDWVQPRLSLSAWSVLCVIVRRTRGWGKKCDAISYEQIKAATGIKSSATIAKALNELLSELTFGKPLVRRQRNSERAASSREATRYALNPRFEIEAGVQKPEARKGLEGREEELPSCSLESEEPDEVRALVFEAPEGVRHLENEETKETPSCDEVKSSGCEHARASPSSSASPSPRFNTHHSSFTTPLLASVCAATLRDPAIVSAKMKAQLIACANKLERAGYTGEQIGLAAAQWPYPTAPHPSQLLDNIAALLSARTASPAPSLSRRATSSNPAAAQGGSRSRSECAAERKSRKWADWLADLGAG